MSSRQYQAHIFFDNGVRDTRLTKFALQLIHNRWKLTHYLDIGVENAAKVMTPYGQKLTWEMARVDPNQPGMHFSIHLKDNKKVKSKKRWSQVMYMSYVLDFVIKEERTAAACDDNNYILTTDADVKFDPESVESLLDLLARDQHVGAVCSRTLPLGSGPIYWFQIFDYAIGHWFQKAANHVLGSVLCCPGCFSVYRVSALRGVLPLYATKVDKASEFLTKDMGEDRWLCSLLVYYNGVFL
ncbi:hypothetical protein CAPTEDRAFT_3956 [Capitella teleta]|uniref:chitin synthase n=1 Tax=Capitella teleta TaxID=283909 RepID=R7V9Z3_CAPTE|nr:hypothetical protein CAPTEDRAFT_3956 [Capitella teleta]|eukprot:ELU12555.1 hypothetical protein CAPTEDRAFT_3956 [Capitella teleta]